MIMQCTFNKYFFKTNYFIRVFLSYPLKKPLEKRLFENVVDFRKMRYERSEHSYLTLNHFKEVTISLNITKVTS